MNRRMFTTSLIATTGLAACQGDAAQALIGQNTNGAGFDLSAIAKPAVIRFWGMWCGPCMVDMPNWLSVVRQLRGSETALKDIAVFTIHVGNPPSNGETLQQWAAAQASDVATPVVDDANYVIAKAVGITGTPSTLYVDGQGIIQEHAWEFKNARGVASFMRKVTHLQGQT
jgi:thiol-disulfide isomerase/thioredoxin